ncbi:MAG: DUF92 domain-containing protein [Gemmatimonas sp.]
MLTDAAPLPIAAGLSALIAVTANRTRSLSLSGALAAFALGAVAMRVSWGMGAYLVLWFALATALSKLGQARKDERTAGIVDKSSQRDAWQVFANGGVFFLLTTAVVIASLLGQPESVMTILRVAAVGSLAAAGADTWATEIGTLVGGAPWSLRSASRVPAGSSGAITVAGTIALLVAACVLAGLAYALGVISHRESVVAVAMGGATGAIGDTLLGAWLQERRWCMRCSTETEQRIHHCSRVTEPHHGIAGFNNDAVNFCCTLIGAAVALLVVLL